MVRMLAFLSAQRARPWHHLARGTLASSPYTEYVSGKGIALPSTSPSCAGEESRLATKMAMELSCAAMKMMTDSKVADGSSKDWGSRGGSPIVDPSGNVLAGPQWEDGEESHNLQNPGHQDQLDP
ncbi:nrps [Epichloe bromicola]|uniref:Nrps n=1 Tax=Epichloe bromicola TaxID=79588 RepID=A0ABQ0CZ18_9HYPO